MSRRIAIGILAALAMMAAMPVPSLAIPVFARKYGFECTMCHSAFPRLNDFGQRFRQNGYQIPGRENEERTVLQGPAPFAARASAGYNYYGFKSVPDAENVHQFQLNGLDLLSGGLFARNIGYIVVYPPKIEASRGVVGQEGTLEMASVVFSNIYTSWANVRVGRFEPAYVVFSVKRHLSFSPYDIYDYGFPGGATFSDTQTGVEVYGQDRFHWGSFGYAAGVLNGSSTNLSDDGPADFYGRAYAVIGAGEGQTAGQRIGLVGYYGKARPDDFSQAGQKCFSRFGVDASLNYKTWNLALQYLEGTDKDPLWGVSESADFHGGFAELSFQPMRNLVAFARYDTMNEPDATLDTDTEEMVLRDAKLSRYSLGARYYFVDQLALHGEYSHALRSLDDSNEPDMKEDFWTLALDFAF
jgi:hypothetical protein